MESQKKTENGAATFSADEIVVRKDRDGKERRFPVVGGRLRLAHGSGGSEVAACISSRDMPLIEQSAHLQQRIEQLLR